MNSFKEIFSDILLQEIQELSQEEIFNLIEIPPQGLGSDLAFPTFSLAKIRHNSPLHITQEILKNYSTRKKKKEKDRTLEVKGPYINISFAPEFVLENFSRGDISGDKNKKKELILIESPSPNTNKPLHLGHVRNMVLGNTLDRTLRYEGYDTRKVEVINDRGIHICKSMLAYRLRGNDAKPDKKGDHFVGDRYIRYAQEVEKDPSLEIQAQEMLRLRESGDPEVYALWEKMNAWAIEGMKETYERYHTRIDDETLESEVYLEGKDIVKDGLEKGIFVRDPKGNAAFPLEAKDDTINYFVVLRADETSVYATQDLALVEKRFQKYKMDKMVYIVGDEQNAYFSTLFKVFTALQYPFAKQCFHLSYGMIELPSGKMKSRTGNVVDADDILNTLHTLSFQEIIQRFPNIDEQGAHERAEKIALGAITFFMIKIDAKKGFVFDPTESLSFEGETGPYIQYSYARINSLFKKVGEKYGDLKEILESGKKERSLIFHKKQDSQEREDIKNILFHLYKFNEIISEVNSEYKPHSLARYALDLCQKINSYYQNYRIITEEKDLSEKRLSIIRIFQKNLSQTMNILGIPIIEEM